MNLNFECGNEKVRLEIDRENKRLKVATSKTNYELKEVPWTYLFDNGKEKEQEAITDKLDNNEFKMALIMDMHQKKYRLR